jgi:hypothetical protein
MADMIKVSLNLTPDEWEWVGEIAKAKGKTKTEIIRSGIGMVKFFNSIRDDEKVVIEGSDKRKRELVKF